MKRSDSVDAMGELYGNQPGTLPGCSRSRCACSPGCASGPAGPRAPLELPDGATLADVWPALDLGAEPSGVAYACNREYAERDRLLSDGDEVAGIPPVSGGGFRVQGDPLDLAAVVAEVQSPAAGAIATFIGTTREHSRGRVVIQLEYDAYPEMAEAEMRRSPTR